MKMHIDEIDKHKNDLLNFIYFAAFENYFNKNGWDSFKPTEDGNYEIKFSVNGIELDFKEAMKEIQEQLDDLVKKKAIQLLKYQCGELDNILFEMNSAVKRSVIKIANEKLGTQIDPWSDFT